MADIKEWFCSTEIKDSELSPNSDWIWLTPKERIGVQCREDFEIAKRLIAKRKNEL